ncbi:TetR/AcrR family transcriptional regulator [Saccharothrix australiensis]|uniref:TetR family transcriptional regulator n=1 Tax=Saccharothrix australiensis TaxID=2072 RepID=A0A495VX29_9PSEU|nr:TetR/AcrR family transcriptional regulator C-terminal domain-containing protein [Saccharothrix australiensis]RKT53799.1 TetR family transcriptional regulator [Saccharothrix australiensis]
MTDERRAPRSRRERPAKAPLTREGIVAAAIGIMRAEGLGKVTMRRLAQELDTGPASLYVYVRDTAELHAAILDELMGAVEPVTTGGDWRDRVERLLTSYTMTLFEHPGLARSALVSRPSGRHYLDLVDTLLGLLVEGGVPAGQAAWGVDVLLQHATATAAEQATRDGTGRAEAEWDALARALHGASERTHPHVAALAGPLLSGTASARLSWAFRLLLNGIEHTPVPGRPPDDAPGDPVPHDPAAPRGER